MASIGTNKILDDVRANMACLESCEGPHDFKVRENAALMSNRYICTKCLGKINGSKYHWYMEGLKHGKS